MTDALKAWTERLVGLAQTGHTFEETIEKIGMPPCDEVIRLRAEVERLTRERDEALRELRGVPRGVTDNTVEGLRRYAIRREQDVAAEADRADRAEAALAESQAREAALREAAGDVQRWLDEATECPSCGNDGCSAVDSENNHVAGDRCARLRAALADAAAQSPARPDGGSLAAVAPPSAATSAASGEPDALSLAAIECAEALSRWGTARIAFGECDVNDVPLALDREDAETDAETVVWQALGAYESARAGRKEGT